MMTGQEIVREGRMALVRVPVHLAACIDAEPDGGAADVGAHELLMDYLLGQNASQQPVLLRAPVEQSADDEWQLTEKAALVRFDFPAGASIGHYPQPTDPRVRLETVAESCCATIWFAGEPSEVKTQQQAARLRDFIEGKGFCELPSASARGFTTETFGPFAAFTRLSIPVSNWRPRGGFENRRPVFRKLAAKSSRTPMTP